MRYNVRLVPRRNLVVMLAIGPQWYAIPGGCQHQNEIVSSSQVLLIDTNHKPKFDLKMYSIHCNVEKNDFLGEH